MQDANKRRRVQTAAEAAAVQPTTMVEWLKRLSTGVPNYMLLFLSARDWSRASRVSKTMRAVVWRIRPADCQREHTTILTQRRLLYSEEELKLVSRVKRLQNKRFQKTHEGTAVVAGAEPA